VSWHERKANMSKLLNSIYDQPWVSYGKPHLKPRLNTTLKSCYIAWTRDIYWTHFRSARERKFQPVCVNLIATTHCFGEQCRHPRNTNSCLSGSRANPDSSLFTSKCSWCDGLRAARSHYTTYRSSIWGWTRETIRYDCQKNSRYLYYGAWWGGR